MAAQVVRDEPALAGQRALVLLVPAQMALRQTVDEHDRWPVRPTPFAHVQAQAATARHGMDCRLLDDCCHGPSSARSVDSIVTVRQQGRHPERTTYPRSAAYVV